MSKLFRNPNRFLAFSAPSPMPSCERIFYTAYAASMVVDKDYVDPTTGEVIAHKGDVLTHDVFNRITRPGL